MTMLLLRCPAATTSAAAAATSTCSSKLESLFGPPSISRGRRPASTSTSTPAGTSIQQSQSPSLWHTATFSQNRRPQNTRINFRHFHYSVSTFGKNKDAEKAAPTEVELAETEETVPEWQNPLHHNNSEVNKMFEEDFQEGQEIVPAPLPPFETDPEKVVAPPHVHDLAHQIVNLTLLELKELTDKIAQHFDFDDQVMAASYSGGAAMATATAAPQEETQEQKVIFDLKLVGYDAKAKIKVIKEIRAIAGLGLKEAKELVESAPKIFQKDLKQEKADELKAQLEAVGAQVEVV